MTLRDTAMRARELVFGPLRDTDAETLLADYAVIATARGVLRALWPAGRAAFAAYWSESVASLRVTRTVYPRLPKWVRFAAQRRYLASFRRTR